MRDEQWCQELKRQKKAQQEPLMRAGLEHRSSGEQPEPQRLEPREEGR
jgi:hypothetical protein